MTIVTTTRQRHFTRKPVHIQYVDGPLLTYVQLYSQISYYISIQ